MNERLDHEARAQVRAHPRWAVATNAALLAGVTDVERAAAADYLTGRG